MTTTTIKLVVSEYLEQIAIDAQKKKGLDLADYRLENGAKLKPIHSESLLSVQPLIVKTFADWRVNPGSVLRPGLSQLEYL